MGKTNLKNVWNISKNLMFETYIQENSEKLISNIYMNILVGYNRFPKPYGFFKKLSSKIKLTSSQCMTRFYKIEKHIFTKLLCMPEMHYNLFKSIQYNKNKISLKVNK